MNMFNLKGSVALITGASSGLGAHFASVLAQAGANTVLIARRGEKIASLAQSIQKEKGRQSLAITADLRKEKTIIAAFNQACASLAPPNIIINNAGIAYDGFAHDMSEEQWMGVINTNLTALWRVSKIAAQRLIEAKKAGVIINISSLLASRVIKGLAAYGASKAGVSQLTKSMAIELAPHHIRVNALAPGYFPTDMNRDFLKSAAGQKMLSQVPLKRAGRLEELSAPLLLLASDEGSYITGEVIAIDGGHRYA